MRIPLESGGKYANLAGHSNLAKSCRILPAIPIAQASEDHLDRFNSSQGLWKRSDQIQNDLVAFSVLVVIADEGYLAEVSIDWKSLEWQDQHKLKRLLPET